MRGVVSVLAALAVASRAAAQEPATDLSLPDLVREALDRNPEIQMAARSVEAKRARAPRAAALPDPMLMLGVMNEGRPVPFQTLGEAGFSEAYLGISQELPFPGKRRLAGRLLRRRPTLPSGLSEAYQMHLRFQIAVVGPCRPPMETCTSSRPTAFRMRQGPWQAYPVVGGPRRAPRARPARPREMSRSMPAAPSPTRRVKPMLAAVA